MQGISKVINRTGKKKEIRHLNLIQTPHSASVSIGSIGLVFVVVHWGYLFLILLFLGKWKTYSGSCTEMYCLIRSSKSVLSSCLFLAEQSQTEGEMNLI